MQTKNKVVPGILPSVGTEAAVKTPGVLEPPAGAIVARQIKSKAVAGVDIGAELPVVMAGAEDVGGDLKTIEDIQAWKAQTLSELEQRELEYREALRQGYEKAMATYEVGKVIPGLIVGSPPTAYAQSLAALRESMVEAAKQVEEIAAGAEEYIGKKEEFETENIKLETGEYVNRRQYDRLTKAQQKVLMSEGIEGFQASVTAVQDKMTEEGYIKDGKIDVIEAVKYGKLHELEMLGLSRKEVGDILEAKEAQRRREVELMQVSHFKTEEGTYDVVAMVEANLSPITIRKYFGSTALKSAKEIAAAKEVMEPYLQEPEAPPIEAAEFALPEGEVRTLAEAAVKKFEPEVPVEGPSYDIVAAIEGGVSDDVLSVLFSEDSIASAHGIVDAKVEMEPYLTDEGGYDIVAALEDGIVPIETIQVLFSEDDIAGAQVIVDAKTELQPYQTEEGGYDLVAAVQAVESGTLSMDSLNVLFTTEDISAAQTTADALVQLEPYQTVSDEGVTSYDLVGAVDAGVSPEVLSVLFSPEDISGAQDFVANNVQLSTGEWVSKTDFEAMPVEDQGKLMELGIEGYNTYVQQQFEAANVQLGDGQWITKESFAELTPQMQTVVLEQGLEGISTEGLTAEQKFVKYTEWGLIPEGAEFAGEADGEPTYYTPEQVHVRVTLEPYVTDEGQLDYYNALKDGVSVDVLISAGVSEEDIAKVQDVLVAEDTLEPYITAGGEINIISALQGGISPEVLSAVGVEDDVISDAQAVLPYISEDGVDVVAALDAGVSSDSLALVGIEVSEDDYANYQTTKAELAEAEDALAELPSPYPTVGWWLGGTHDYEAEAAYEAAQANVESKKTACAAVIHGIMTPYLTYDIAGQEIAAEDWEAMTPGKQFEMLMGREPSPQEYREYYIHLTPGTAAIEYKTVKQDISWSGFFGTVDLKAGDRIPKDWRESYESEYGKIGVWETMLWAGEIFVPPLRALGPAGIGEITPTEWAIGAINVATIIAPIPKIGSLVKVPLKYAGRALGAAETLLIPGKIPSGAITYPLGRLATVRVRLPTGMAATEFRPYVSKLFERVAAGVEPIVELPGGGILKATPSALQKVLGPTVAHATHVWPAFAGEVLTVSRPLFTGPWLYTKFAVGTARGKLSTSPGGIFVRLTKPLATFPKAVTTAPTMSRMFSMASRYLQSGFATGRYPVFKTYRGTFELESIYGKGAKLWAQPQPAKVFPTYTRVGLTRIPIKVFTEEAGVYKPFSFGELYKLKWGGFKKLFRPKPSEELPGMLEVEYAGPRLAPGYETAPMTVADITVGTPRVLLERAVPVTELTGGLATRPLVATAAGLRLAGVPGTVGLRALPIETRPSYLGFPVLPRPVVPGRPSFMPPPILPIIGRPAYYEEEGRPLPVVEEGLRTAPAIAEGRLPVAAESVRGVPVVPITRRVVGTEVEGERAFPYISQFRGISYVPTTYRGAYYTPSYPEKPGILYKPVAPPIPYEGRIVYPDRGVRRPLVGVIAGYPPPLLFPGESEEAKPVMVNLRTEVSPVGSGLAEPRVGHFQAGETVEVRAIPYEGTKFVRWEGDISSKQNPVKVTMDRDKRVVAVFSGEPKGREMELPGLMLYMPEPLEPVTELERPRRVIKKRRIPIVSRRMVPTTVYKEIR